MKAQERFVELKEDFEISNAFEEKFENAMVVAINELYRCRDQIESIISDLKATEIKKDINIVTRLSRVENRIDNVKNHFKKIL